MSQERFQQDCQRNCGNRRNGGNEPAPKRTCWRRLHWRDCHKRHVTAAYHIDYGRRSGSSEYLRHRLGSAIMHAFAQEPHLARREHTAGSRGTSRVVICANERPRRTAPTRRVFTPGQTGFLCEFVHTFPRLSLSLASPISGTILTLKSRTHGRVRPGITQKDFFNRIDNISRH
jgi:hypothetical protein